MTFNNYPPGAANDPRAPYNEPQWPEIDVTVTAVLEKKTVLLGSGTHTCVECETEPDGSRSYIRYEESDDDVSDLFSDQSKSPAEILSDCEKVVKELKRLILAQKVEGISSLYFAKVYLPALLDAIDGWEETELTIEEG